MHSPAKSPFLKQHLTFRWTSTLLVTKSSLNPTLFGPAEFHSLHAHSYLHGFAHIILLSQMFFKIPCDLLCCNPESHSWLDRLFFCTLNFSVRYCLPGVTWLPQVFDSSLQRISFITEWQHLDTWISWGEQSSTKVHLFCASPLTLSFSPLAPISSFLLMLCPKSADVG